MDQTTLKRSISDAFRKRADEFAVKAGQAQSPEAKQAFLDLAQLYEDLSKSVEHLELQAPLGDQDPD
jgi:hypothetical protein